MNQYLYQDPGTSRLEEFSTKHELARNFYDDDEFCPIPSEKLPQVAEHRERIQFRTSPRSSPSSSPTRSNAYHQGLPLRQSPRTRAVPIVDPSKRTTVNVTQATNANSNTHLYSVPIQESHQSTTTTPSWVSPRRYGIPIVDPSSGNMILSHGNTVFPHHQQHHQAGYYVSVR